MSNKPREKAHMGTLLGTLAMVCFVTPWVVTLILIGLFTILYFYMYMLFCVFILFHYFLKTLKNESAKLFFRDPSWPPIFVKYPLAQDEGNNPESEPEQQDQEPEKPH